MKILSLGRNISVSGQKLQSSKIIYTQNVAEYKAEKKRHDNERVERYYIFAWGSVIGIILAVLYPRLILNKTR